MVQERERDEAATQCTDCSRDLGIDGSQVFSSDGVSLCWECALKRGGVFDAKQDRWTRPPDVSDLPDERRPHP